MGARRAADRPELLLRRNGITVCRLAPGEKKLIGRAPAADVQLGHPGVSRLHARVAWPDDRARPVVEDLESANGVSLNGRRIAQLAELADGVTLALGPVELAVELVANTPPAVLEDGGTVRVRLFSECGPERRGTVRDAQHLRDILLELEARRRTGTLLLPDQGEVVLARGRVVDALAGGSRGLSALRRLVSSCRAGAFEFKLDVTPRESDLDVSVREVLQASSAVTERGGVRPVRHLAS